MSWFIFFLILPHLCPSSLEYLWPTVDTAFNGGRVVSAVIILYLYILKRRLPSVPVWILFVLQLWLCIITVIKGAELYSLLISSASILAVALLTDLYADQMKMLISSIFLNFEILIYANLLSVLLYYPMGLYINPTHFRCYFLGYHNQFIVYVLPLIVLAVLYWRIYRKALRPFFSIVAGSLSIIITWSATSFCFLVILAGMLLLGLTPMKKKITFPLIFCVTMVINLAISVFRVMDRVMWIAWSIEAILKKQITLTGRTFIWDEFYRLFKSSPIIGYGMAYKEVANDRFLAIHAHNQWFQMLFQGGIVALIIYLTLNFVIGKRLMQFRNNPYTYLFLSVFTALYIAFIAEVYSNPLIYILYILAYHINKLPLPGSSYDFSDRSYTRKRYSNRK